MIATALILFLVVLAAASQPALLWLNVPFEKQEKNACGAASLSMVMQYWAQQQGKTAGPDANSASIMRELYSEEAKGIFASQLKRYLERHDFRVFVFEGSWDDLDRHLAKGRPLIVALGEFGSRGPLHYVVAAGIDRERRDVMINDPASRKLRRVAWQEFDRDWSGTKHWTLLAVPR